MREMPEPAPLTAETILAAIAEIKAAPRVPVIERRGTTIYVDGVPTFELNAPILTRPMDWSPAARSMLFAASHPGMTIAIQEAAAQQLAERRNRIIDMGTS